MISYKRSIISAGVLVICITFICSVGIGLTFILIGISEFNESQETGIIESKSNAVLISLGIVFIFGGIVLIIVIIKAMYNKYHNILETETTLGIETSSA